MSGFTNERSLPFLSDKTTFLILDGDNGRLVLPDEFPDYHPMTFEVMTQCQAFTPELEALYPGKLTGAMVKHCYGVRCASADPSVDMPWQLFTHKDDAVSCVMEDWERI